MTTHQALILISLTSLTLSCAGTDDTNTAPGAAGKADTVAADASVALVPACPDNMLPAYADPNWTNIPVRVEGNSRATFTYDLSVLGDAAISYTKNEAFFGPGTDFWPSVAIREGKCQNSDGREVPTLTIDAVCDYESERGFTPYDAPNWTYQCGIWLAIEARIRTGASCDLPTYTGVLNQDDHGKFGVVCEGYDTANDLCQQGRCVAP